MSDKIRDYYQWLKTIWKIDNVSKTSGKVRDTKWRFFFWMSHLSQIMKSLHEWEEPQELLSTYSKKLEKSQKTGVHS